MRIYLKYILLALVLCSLAQARPPALAHSTLSKCYKDNNIDPLKNELALKLLMKMYGENPLIQSFEKNIERIQEIDNQFSMKKNDPIFLSYSLYLIYSLTAFDLETITRNDIKELLDVLRDFYDINIPKSVNNLISQFESLERVTTKDGRVGFRIRTKNSKNIEMLFHTPNEEKKLKAEDSPSIILSALHIDNGATIIFKTFDKRQKQNSIDDYLGDLGMFTQIKDNHFERFKEYRESNIKALSPIQLEVTGLSFDAKLRKGDYRKNYHYKNYDGSLNNVLITPGIELTDHENTFNRIIKNPELAQGNQMLGSDGSIEQIQLNSKALIKSLKEYIKKLSKAPTAEDRARLKEEYMIVLNTSYIDIEVDFGFAFQLETGV